MKRLFSFLFFFSIGIWAMRVEAQLPPAPVPLPALTLLGAGASTCAKFLADTQSSQGYQAVYSNWALGYITALNVINSGKPGAKTFGDAAGVDIRVRNYCAMNPSKTYSDAVTDLAVQFFR